MLSTSAAALQTPFARKERTEGAVVTFLLNALFAWGTVTSWGKQSLPVVFAYDGGEAGVSLVSDLIVTTLLVGILPALFLAPKVKVSGSRNRQCSWKLAVNHSSG